MVLGWFDRLPEETLKSAPFLCICKGWALVLMRRGVRWEETNMAVDSALQALERVKADEKLRRLVTGHAASIRAFIPLTPTLAGKNPEEQIALAEEAQALLPEGEQAIRSINALNIGVGKKALADMEAASLAFDQVLEYGLAGGNYYAAIYGPINLVECALLVGRLEKALQLCEANIELFNRILPGQYFPPIGALDVMKGIILLEYNRLEEAKRALTEGLDLVRWTGEYSAHIKGYTALAWLHAIQGNRQAALAAVSALEENWPEGQFYTRALRQRFLTDHWPDDPEVMNEAHTWLNQSGIEFAELGAIHHVDAVGEVYFTFYLNAAHTLARLAKRNPGSFPVDGAQAYLERQQDFAETHGIISWVVAVAIARTLLFQAAGKKYEALETLAAALSAAAPTGLWRIFLDECELLQALLGELKPRLSDESVIVYANRLFDAMSCGAAKPESVEGYSERLSERELEVLGYLAQGLTYEEIGRQLYLSLNTVQFHVKNIYGKLLVNKRAQAIEKAREMKLI
jgi:LuxR family maltose regulon positive regulatory protein